MIAGALVGPRLPAQPVVAPARPRPAARAPPTERSFTRFRQRPALLWGVLVQALARSARRPARPRCSTTTPARVPSASRSSAREVVADAPRPTRRLDRAPRGRRVGDRRAGPAMGLGSVTRRALQGSPGARRQRATEAVGVPGGLPGEQAAEASIRAQVVVVARLLLVPRVRHQRVGRQVRAPGRCDWRGVDRPSRCARRTPCRARTSGRCHQSRRRARRPRAGAARGGVTYPRSAPTLFVRAQPARGVPDGAGHAVSRQRPNLRLLSGQCRGATV